MFSSESADVVTLLAAESTEFAFVFVRLDDPRLQQRNMSDSAAETNPLVLLVRRAIGAQQQASMKPAAAVPSDGTPNGTLASDTVTTPSPQPASPDPGAWAESNESVRAGAQGPRMARADTIAAPVMSASWQDSATPDRSAVGLAASGRLSRPAPPPPKPPRPPPRPDPMQTGRPSSCGAPGDSAHLSSTCRRASAAPASASPASVSPATESPVAASTGSASSAARRTPTQDPLAPRLSAASSAAAPPASHREPSSWFFADASRTKRGPVSQSDLIELLQGGDIDKETLVRTSNPTPPSRKPTLCLASTLTRRRRYPKPNPAP